MKSTNERVYDILEKAKVLKVKKRLTHSYPGVTLGIEATRTVEAENRITARSSLGDQG